MVLCIEPMITVGTPEVEILDDKWSAVTRDRSLAAHFEHCDDGIKAWLNEDSTAMTNNGGNDTIAAVTAMGYDAYYVALEALKAAGSTDAGVGTLHALIVAM